jgi:hypothetical protein
MLSMITKLTYRYAVHVPYNLQIIRLIGRAMSSASAVQSSFLLERDGLAASALEREGLTTTASGVPVDVMKLDFIYAKIFSCEHEGVRNSIAYALEGLSNDIRFQASASLSGPSLVPFVAILEAHELCDARFLETMRNLIYSLNMLPTPSKLRLMEYICNSSDARFSRHVSVLQHYIAGRTGKGAFEEAKAAVAVLSIWYACTSLFPSVPLSKFYSEAINEQYASTRGGKRAEYALWLSDLKLKHGRGGVGARPPAPNGGRGLTRVSSGLFSLSVPLLPRASAATAAAVSSVLQLGGATAAAAHPTHPTHGTVKMPLCCRHKYDSLISYPFILSAGVKAAILELDAARQMREGTESEMQQAVATGSRYVIPYLVIRIRRSHIVEDAINQFAAQDDGSFDLKKPLKVCQ